MDAWGIPQRPENKHVRPWEEKSEREVICLFSQSLLISQLDAFASEQLEETVKIDRSLLIAH